VIVLDGGVSPCRIVDGTPAEGDDYAIRELSHITVLRSRKCAAAKEASIRVGDRAAF